MAAAGTTLKTLPPGHDMPWPLGTSLTHGAHPVIVTRARFLTTHTLRRWYFAEQQITDAEIVVSELVTNAVHACGGNPSLPVTLTLRSNFGSLVIEVTDPVVDPPVPRNHDMDSAEPDEGGYGLGLVTFLSQSWGYYLAHSGKVVWAVFDRY